MSRIGLTPRGLPLVAAILVLLLAGTAAAGPPRKVTPGDLDKLFELLEKGKHFKVRVQAAKALGLMKVQAAVPNLIKSLSVDEDHLVRGTAAWALGSIGHPGAVDALATAEKKDVDFVGKQAGRARSHIIARFPGNLPAPQHTQYHLRLRGLGTQDQGEQKLVRWLVDGIATRFVVYDNFDFGEEIIVDEDGEYAVPADDSDPVIRLDLVGGIQAVDAPADRGAGKVTVTLALGARWLPPKRTLMKTRTYKGTASFEGGPPPASELDEDPLFEAKKIALDAAAAGGARDLVKVLKLNP